MELIPEHWMAEGSMMPKSLLAQVIFLISACSSSAEASAELKRDNFPGMVRDVPAVPDAAASIVKLLTDSPGVPPFPPSPLVPSSAIDQRLEDRFKCKAGTHTRSSWLT